MNIKPSRRKYVKMGVAIKNKTITPEMFKDVVEYVKSVEHPFFVLYYENLYLLAFETGARISEIVPIHETDLDLKYGEVHYEIRKKLKKPLKVSKNLTPELLDRLREHVKQYSFQIGQSGGFIFFGMSQKTKYLEVKTAQRHFSQARDAAGHNYVYGESKQLYRITNTTTKPQQFSVYGKVEQNGKEVEVVLTRFMLLPGEHSIRHVDPERYKKDKRFSIKKSHKKKLRQCTIHSVRHLSMQTVLEDEGLFGAYHHSNHVSITSTMEYLDVNPKKKQKRVKVFRGIYGTQEEHTKKATVAIAEDQAVMDAAAFNPAMLASVLSTALTQALVKMQQEKVTKEQRMQEEFEAFMKMKAQQEHKNTFARIAQEGAKSGD